jgi:hypothetical protein
MKILVWAGLFLLLAVVGSVVGAAAIVGLPIATFVEGVFGVVVAAFVVWGIALFTAPARLVPSCTASAADVRDRRECVSI